MSAIKAALLVGGPLDGKNMEISTDMHDYMQAPYDVDAQLGFDFTGAATKRDRSTVRIAIYREMPDGTHWKYAGDK
jgi:hypothetical protein